VLARQQGRWSAHPTRAAAWSQAVDLLRDRQAAALVPRWDEPTWTGPSAADVDRARSASAGSLPVAVVLVGGSPEALRAEATTRLPELKVLTASLAGRLR
jgi:hypothetical protein